MPQIWKKWLLLLSNLAFHIAGYLGVNQLTHDRGVNYSVALPLDAHIPFLSFFSPFYAIVYFVPVISFFICWKNYELIKAAWKAFMFAGSVCLLCFYFYPVAFQLRQPLQPPYGFFEEIVRFFYWIDTPYNCFPSMHVALAFVSVQMIERYSPRLYPWFFSLAIVITFSTFFVKQHYIMDAVGGIFLAYLSGRIFLPKKVSEPVLAEELA